MEILVCLELSMKIEQYKVWHVLVVWPSQHVLRLSLGLSLTITQYKVWHALVLWPCQHVWHSLGIDLSLTITQYKVWHALVLWPCQHVWHSLVLEDETCQNSPSLVTTAWILTWYYHWSSSLTSVRYCWCQGLYQKLDEITSFTSQHKKFIDKEAIQIFCPISYKSNCQDHYENV